MRASGPRFSRIHCSTRGWARVQILRAGLSWRLTPSAISMFFCSSRSWGWASISKDSERRRSWPSTWAKEISSRERPKIGSPMERQAWVNSSSDWSAGTKPAANCTSATRAVVALQEAQQHVGEVVARLAVEPAHDAEIDGADIALEIDEHVPGMLVAVEEAVAEGLLEEDRRGAGRAPDRCRCPAASMPARSSMRMPVSRSRVSDASRRPPPVDLRARDRWYRRRNSPPARRRRRPPAGDRSRPGPWRGRS